jgi:hypothetical protein
LVYGGVAEEWTTPKLQQDLLMEPGFAFRPEALLSKLGCLRSDFNGAYGIYRACDHFQISANLEAMKTAAIAMVKKRNALIASPKLFFSARVSCWPRRTTVQSP